MYPRRVFHRALRYLHFPAEQAVPWANVSHDWRQADPACAPSATPEAVAEVSSTHRCSHFVTKLFFFGWASPSVLFSAVSRTRFFTVSIPNPLRDETGAKQKELDMKCTVLYSILRAVLRCMGLTMPCLLTIASLSLTSHAQQGLCGPTTPCVTTWHNDLNRTGLQPNEPTLNQTNVGTLNSFGLLARWGG